MTFSCYCDDRDDVHEYGEHDDTSGNDNNGDDNDDGDNCVQDVL